MFKCDDTQLWHDESRLNVKSEIENANDTIAKNACDFPIVCVLMLVDVNSVAEAVIAVS